MEKKTVHLAPLPSDWGDIHVNAIIITKDKESTLSWEIDYPAAMPEPEREVMNETIKIFMRNQQEDLISMFGD